MSTYRLQLHDGFVFDDAARLVPQLAGMGVSHLYLSPVLEAVPGSLHGYDVVDHDRVSVERGGEEALVRLADAAHDHGLGVIVDIVPNHMALPTPAHLNQPLWQVLREGRDAPTAHWFDIDWDHSHGRFPLLVLDAPLAEVVAAGRLSLAEIAGEQVVRHGDQVFPVAPGTGGDDIAAVIDRQHWLLASWRDRDLLTYRRFFDVDTLIGIRVEDPDVFDATHRVLVDLHRQGVIDGFRVDHPDGLADPRAYLERLREVTDGAWVVVEKVLEHGERLPESWACAGTTGYDALAVIQQALVPPVHDDLGHLWEEIAGDGLTLTQVKHRGKHDVLAHLLQPELDRLARVAVTAAADSGVPLPADVAADALAELLVQMDVYRAYVRLDEPVDETAARQIDAAGKRARAHRGDLAETLVLLERLVTDTTTTSPAGRDLVVRFQQTSGPVMAKGVEDTTFYRWHELVALNEVGGDPAMFAAPTTAALHDWSKLQSTRHPNGMTTLSTHDTKRSEDVRSRLLAMAGDPRAWRTAWEPVRAAADELGLDRPTAYLAFQTVLGVWPIDQDRLDAYLIKATREDKRQTTWNNPDEQHEARVLALAARLRDDPTLTAAITGLLEHSAAAIRATTLTTKLMQLTMPGTADCYQGQEVVDLSLVDPDNRRPVDFATITQRLARLDAGAQPADLADEKLLVTSGTLRLRRRCAPAFMGTCEPVTATGPHLLGHVRGGSVVALGTRWPTALASAGGWQDATLVLPDGRWIDVFTSVETDGGRQSVASLLTDLPVALLERVA